MDDLKQWMNDHWNGALINGAYRNVFTEGSTRIRAGSAPVYKSKKQKAYEARFGIYNKKLVPIILAEATRDDRSSLPRYSWPKVERQPDAPDIAETVPAVPRKRVPKAKLEQAAAIIAKVPQDELVAFLARFGLSMALAASIASLDNAEMIARQFLRVTL